MTMNYQEELKAMESEQKQYPAAWKIPAGTTEFSILSDDIQERDTENGKKKLVPVQVGEFAYTWWLSVKNPTWKFLVRHGVLKGSIRGKFSITRVGERKATRYEMKAL